MFTYLPRYRVLICGEHQQAVYRLDKHMKRHHSLPIAQRRELLAAYAGLAINTPMQITLRYMTISIEGSMKVAANQQRCSPAPLPSTSPHQNPRLLLRLASCRTEYRLLCVASITHYPFHLHLDFKIKYTVLVREMPGFT
jgi:hypothetical protein